MSNTQWVLFHLGIVDELPRCGGSVPFTERLADLPGHGSWLKIPLGKLETERMVPIDDDICTWAPVTRPDRLPATYPAHPRDPLRPRLLQPR